MDLTEENKKYIDCKSYEDLLFDWRNAPVGSPWFQGETGDYLVKLIDELRAQREAMIDTLRPVVD